ncbi:hypothetical protein R3P38DRAFT_3119758 [Favolaschia claudopus]|uniref:Uncharacterized protein n=1 Tax=Favolaschia claudopus TaxID=2862362 RepID=A0AAV9ZDT5_9AGAR
MTSASTSTVSPRPKDYQAAFGNLQSTYGMNGSAPIPKDFSAAFGDLQSTYGFAGAIPSPVPKLKSRPERSENASFASRFGRLSQMKPTVRAVPESS